MLPSHQTGHSNLVDNFFLSEHCGRTVTQRAYRTLKLEELPHDQRFLGAISAVRYKSLIKQYNKEDLIVVVTTRLTDTLKNETVN